MSILRMAEAAKIFAEKKRLKRWNACDDAGGKNKKVKRLRPEELSIHLALHAIYEGTG